jgi:hypothetical protein
MVMRCSVGQADAAQWAFEYLDAKAAGGVDRYRLAGGGDDTIRMFVTPNSVPLEEFLKLAVRVRTTVQASRLYTYSPRRVIAIRGSEELIGRAAELLAKP